MAGVWWGKERIGTSCLMVTNYRNCAAFQQVLRDPDKSTPQWTLTLCCGLWQCAKLCMCETKEEEGEMRHVVP